MMKHLSPCSATGEAIIVRSPCTAVREEPLLTAARESLFTAKNTQGNCVPPNNNNKISFEKIALELSEIMQGKHLPLNLAANLHAVNGSSWWW